MTSSDEGLIGVSADVISVCLLNFNRPELLKHAVLPLLENCELIDEVIISHGCRETVFDYVGQSCDVIHRHDYGEINDTYGLSRRWLCWQAAKNQAVLSLDDDVAISPQTIALLHESFLRDPQIVHSLVGRKVGPGMKYMAMEHYGKVELALTGVAILHKSLGSVCLEHKHLVDDFVRENSRPLWNGEDVFACLLAMKMNNRLNECLRLPYVFLYYMASSDFSVSEWSAHYKYRGRLIKEVAQKLNMLKLLRKDEPNRRLKLEKWSINHAKQYVKYKLLGARFKVTRELLMPRHKEPGFMVVGGEACGVSALYQSLGEHPEIRSLPVTRSDYFIKNFRLGEHNLRYHAHNINEGYQYKKQFPRIKERHIAGEASEMYFYAPEVPAAISTCYPRTRFIVMVRNPTERAWAAYWRYKNRPYSKEENREESPILLEAVAQERELLGRKLPMLLSTFTTDEFARQTKRISNMRDEKGAVLYPCNHGYLARGMFAFWIKHWYHFFKPEQFLILSYEELFANPIETVRRAHSFIGLEPKDCAPYADMPQMMPPMDERARAELDAYYAEHNQALFELAGKAFAWT